MIRRVKHLTSSSLAVVIALFTSSCIVFGSGKGFGRGGLSSWTMLCWRILLLLLIMVLFCYSYGRKKSEKVKVFNYEGSPNDTLPVEDTVFKSNYLPDEIERHMATVGNGFLATVVYWDRIFVNGVYNGAKGKSHRARIPATCSLRLSVDSYILTHEYELDVAKGVFTEYLDHEDFSIQYQIYAHRQNTKLLICTVKAVARKPGIVLRTHNNHGSESKDFRIVSNSTYNSTYKEAQHKRMKTVVPELKQSGLTDVYLYYDEVPATLHLAMGEQSWTWVTSIYVDDQDAREAYDFAHSITEAELFASHVAAWKAIWDSGHIQVKGNTFLAQAVYGSLYYLYSSLPTSEDPKWQFYGLSPGSLSHGEKDKDYMGHIFWDQETWMLPPILLLQPEMARLQLQIRIFHLKGALRKANKFKCLGAMYPWESAFTGSDVCPWPPAYRLEHHITGDIAFAFWQYLATTNDGVFMDSAENVFTQIATFWANRTSWKGNKYNINGVMPPDEWHFPVNNSIYTNYIASLSLTLPQRIYPEKTFPKEWSKIADQLLMPFNETYQYHPEFDGYDFKDNHSLSAEGQPNNMVKQADVILLGFPLMYNMSESIRKNDLLIYEKVTSPTGPAMTWGMFTIGLLELGDYEKAAELFQKNFQYIVPPFKIWSETKGGKGAVNFITGMGGFLQALLFGYGGIRIRDDRLDFNPVLPADTEEITITHLDYLGAAFTVRWNHQIMEFIMTSNTAASQPFRIYFYETKQFFPLELNKGLQFRLSRVAIMSTTKSTGRNASSYSTLLLAAAAAVVAWTVSDYLQ